MNINNLHIILTLMLSIVYMWKNTIKDYLLIIKIILTLIPGSYAINKIISENIYWNYLSQIALNNKITYKNSSIYLKAIKICTPIFMKK